MTIIKTMQRNLHQLLIIITVILLSLTTNTSTAQDELRQLTIDDALEIAKQQSPDALIAKHRFRSSYWQYRRYRAYYLPALTLYGTLPDFDRSIRTISTVEGEVFHRSLPMAFTEDYHLTKGLDLQAAHYHSILIFQELITFMKILTQLLHNIVPAY